MENPRAAAVAADDDTANLQQKNAVLGQASRIRHVHSHPSIGASSSAAPGSASLTSLPFNSTMPNASSSTTGLGSSNATISSVNSSIITRPKISPENRSPAFVNSTDDNEDIEEDHDGAHDTITSLAGAKMLQRYRRAMSHGTHKGSSSSLTQQNRLEDLFLIEEDAKDTEEDKETEPESPIEPEEKYPITAEIFVPPDGGYGWLIALGAFNALFWTAGLVKAYGVIFDLILKTFPESSITLAAWIPASMTTLALAMAPFASGLCQRFNCRTVTFAGSILCFIGIASSSFAPNVETLFLTFGLLTGLGIGLSTTPGIILVARYFDKRRGIANAFCLSGTAAGSLCLPFLLDVLVRTYAFKGTLLILGACMLHISISAALYRPLAIHVLISKKNRNIVQLHEATEETVENHQAVNNKESKEHQNHLKKLQLKCQHQQQNHHFDPDDIVYKLQTKLSEIDAEIDREEREDSVSISSSVSQDKHHHHLKHQHHHHHHSGHTTPRNYHHHHHHQQEVSISSGHQTPHQFHSGQHTPRHPHGPLGFRHSFASMAVSLPPGLEYQDSIITPNNSSFASREDLQCNWHELPKFDIEPVMASGAVAGETSAMMQSSTDQSRVKSHDKQSSTLGGNHLSSLFLHQVGRKINQYKSLLVKNSSKKNLPKNASFVSVASANGKGPSPSISRQPSFKQSKDLDVLDSKPSVKSRRPSFQSTLFLFGFEDMTTDSTSVLKDTRHPSLSSVALAPGNFNKAGQQNPKLGRVVSLNRSASSAGDTRRRSRVRRQSSTTLKTKMRRARYMSEGHDNEIYGSKYFVCNDFNKSGSSLCVSMECGLAGAPTPVIMDDANLGNAGDHDKVEKAEKESESVPLGKKIMSTLLQYLDLKLVEEPIFLMMVCSVMTMSVGVPHVLFFVPTYVRSISGVWIDPALLISVTSVADLLGRIAFGFILDSNIAPKHIIYAVMILSSGISVISLSFAVNSVGLVIAMLVYGLGSGAWFLMVPLLLAEYLGVERIGSSYGLIRLFQAMSNLVGPLVGGGLSDYTGSFAASFVVMGLIMCLGSLPIWFKPILEKKQEKKDTGCAE